MGAKSPAGLPPARFGREDRIRLRRDFEALRSGRRLETTHFILLVLPNGRTRSRLGVTASARVGGAVARNRVKRLVRESFRRGRGFIPAGIDLHVIARRGSPAMERAEVEREIRRTLERGRKT